MIPLTGCYEQILLEMAISIVRLRHAIPGELPVLPVLREKGLYKFVAEVCKRFRAMKYMQLEVWKSL